LIFFNRDSTKIGIRRSPGLVSVPGFLFRSEKSPAFLGEQGNLVTSVVKDDPVSVDFSVEADTAWAVKVSSPRPDLVTARQQHGTARATITLSTESAKPIEIESVTLTAVASSPGP
jgi:hypothetical protein